VSSAIFCWRARRLAKRSLVERRAVARGSPRAKAAAAQTATVSWGAEQARRHKGFVSIAGVARSQNSAPTKPGARDGRRFARRFVPRRHSRTIERLLYCGDAAVRNSLAWSAEQSQTTTRRRLTD